MLPIGVTFVGRGRRSVMTDSSLPAIARRQHGLLTRAQVLSTMSSGAIERRVRAGRLEPVRRGVYRMAGAPETWEQQLLAVCLAAGPEVCASFRSAAVLSRLEGFEPELLEVTHFGSRPSEMDGVVIHESSVFDKRHITQVLGIPTTSMARTLCDLTAVVRPWMVERAVDEALRRKLVRIPELVECAELLEGRGRRRCTVMRDILEHRQRGYEPGESEPERRIAELLVRAGLPPPTMQYRVRVGNRNLRIDLCYPEYMIAIEYDGWDWHSGRRAFDEDRARANQLVVLGFSVLRFTSKSGDETIVDTVTAAIQRASRS
jgi:very-short-patch-repair endonuclease